MTCHKNKKTFWIHLDLSEKQKTFFPHIIPVKERPKNLSVDMQKTKLYNLQKKTCQFNVKTLFDAQQKKIFFEGEFEHLEKKIFFWT